MRRIKKIILEYFTFNRSDKRAIIVLLLLIVLIFSVRFFLSFIYSDKSQIVIVNEIADLDSNAKSNEKPDSVNYSPFNPNTATDSIFLSMGLNSKQIKTIRNYIAKIGKFKNSNDFSKVWGISPKLLSKIQPYLIFDSVPGNVKPKAEKEKPEPCQIDPNTASCDEWFTHGLTPKQVEIIEKFLNKGGRFKKKEDLKKLYFMSDVLYGKIEPFIFIQPEIAIKKEPSFKISDINLIDSAGLTEYKFLSPYLIKNILKYRERLGGYISINQLSEVYGMKKDVFEKLKPWVKIESPGLKKLNINKATFAEFLKHPYLNYDQTVSIVKFRKIMGRISRPDDLLKNKIISDTTFYKIQNYLLVE